MTNLFETERLSPQDLFKGDVLYYADSHAVENQLLHLLQVTKVVAITGQSIILDNGRKFGLESCEEVTRGNKGTLYAYTNFTKAMVTEAQNKLILLNDVEGIDFSALTSQQLSIILDVSRGAFTQVTMPTPCGGGCGDTVQVAGIDIEVEPDLHGLATQLGARQPEISATIGFNDASYELSNSELDAIEDADEDDDVNILDEDEE